MTVTKRPSVCSPREIPFLRYAMLCIHRRVGRRRGRVPLTGEKDMAFTDDQLERYSRHLILKEIGVRGQKKLLAARVLVIGAGNAGTVAALRCQEEGANVFLADMQTYDEYDEYACDMACYNSKLFLDLSLIHI